MDRKLAYIPLKLVRENPAALRKVDRESEKYIGLVDSVRSSGVLKPILVHETKDKDSGELVYGLSDGLHRFTAAQDAGLETIPAHIVPLEESEVLATQIIANAHVIETKPAEYSSALVRLLGVNPTMTMSDLAGKLQKSPKWLADRLSLVKLNEDIKALVDENKINLVNAYALAKLPPDEQMNFLDRAMTEQPATFVPSVNQRVKEIRDAKRQGKDDAPEQFVPVPHLRKPVEMKEELERGTVAQIMLGKGQISDADSFTMGVSWALHMDPDSVNEARATWERRKQEQEDSRKKKAEEKAKKKLEDANAELAKLGLAQTAGV